MKTLLKLAVSISVPLVVGVLSGVATARGVTEWYPTLTRPAFTPPSWIFGPVWTLLYLMMGFAAFLVWQWGLEAAGVRVALVAFLVQLALNGLWSLLFFGLRAPGAAFVDIILLWLAIAVTTWLFWRVVHVAGALMLPYLAWVTFAAVLNGSIWSLNR
jgi:translocator protein